MTGCWFLCDSELGCAQVQPGERRADLLPIADDDGEEA
jgi:hypothetical protein